MNQNALVALFGFEIIVNLVEVAGSNANICFEQNNKCCGQIDRIMSYHY